MIAAILDGVLACAYDALTTKPGWKSVTPGPAALDECCDGQLWVNLAGLSPRVDRGCVTGWNMTVSVGLVRCVSVINDRGISPNAAQIRADALQQATDVEELQQALSCCPENIAYVQRSLLGDWTAMNPEGGCAGGTWSLELVIPTCACP